MVDLPKADVNSAGSLSATALADVARTHALELGFELVGIATLQRSAHAQFYHEWLGRQRHGSMDYLARPDAVARRLDPRAQHAELRSAIVVGLNYWSDAEPGGDEKDRGIIARYARGRDYHKVIKRKLLDLLDFLEQQSGRTLGAARAYVDTGPVFERELAQRAGLGWFGRNTMLINPKRGSFFFLGTLLVELDLAADEPFTSDHCGTCQSCVQACPTGALLGRTEEGAPVMDATRCISYLTIEQRGPIPRELRPLIGNRIFGCDICQDVCPWNSPKFVTLTREKDFSSRANAAAPRLTELMRLDEAGWDALTRGSALRRARRSGFLRNVAIALGNSRDPQGVPALRAALTDEEPLVRGHSAWALGEIATGDAIVALEARLSEEGDAWVRTEIESALECAQSALL